MVSSKHTTHLKIILNNNFSIKNCCLVKRKALLFFIVQHFFFAEHVHLKQDCAYILYQNIYNSVLQPVVEAAATIITTTTQQQLHEMKIKAQLQQQSISAQLIKQYAIPGYTTRFPFLILLYWLQLSCTRPLNTVPQWSE